MRLRSKAHTAKLKTMIRFQGQNIQMKIIQKIIQKIIEKINKQKFYS